MDHQTGFDSRSLPEALAVHAELERLLGELDRLGLHESGAHLSFAIHVLERRIAETGRVSPWPPPSAHGPS